MEQYTKLQVIEIKRYSRLLHTDENTAAFEWVRRGLAKHFALKHRIECGLPEETECRKKM